MANRTDSTHTQGYQNGSLVVSPNVAAASALGNANFTVLASKTVGGGVIAGYGAQISMFSIGSSLSSTNVTDFYSALRSYMEAVGIPASYISADADSVDGGWTNEIGGTTLYASIDEHLTPNDADYIRSSDNPSNDVCRVSLGNPPAGIVSQPFEISYRYGKSGTDQIDITVTLKQGTTTIASWTHTDVSA